MTALLMAALSSGPAIANPSGGSVRAGSVNISTVGPNTLHIEQMTQKAIIDWQSFGINPGEAVRFLQPNQLSVILNRVVGQDPSRILGELTANGNVWLINPNGVLFGPGSTVNVGGLVASTLNITNEDFLSGNYRFQQDMSKPLASVVNQGSITITDGGYAVLMAPLVSNEGLIVANLGQVNLLAGESATLNFDGRNLVSYNIGKVEGEAGTVLLSRDAVSGLLANVITSPTLTEAGGMVENADGTISLVGASGTTISEGTITTNGAEGQKAGKIVLDSGRLTVVGPEAVVEATGSGKNSDGGTVLALSEGMLYTAGDSQLKARGSDQGGDGGFVETSGKNFIINSIADVGAAAGKAGEWLIDPEFLTIIEGPRGSGGIDAADPISNPFDTTGLGGQVNTISTGFLKSITSGTVTLQADNQITIGDLVTDLVFKDGVNVKFETLTGDLLFVDRTDKVVVGGTGSLTLDIGRDIYLGIVESTGTGKIDIEYGTDGAGKIYADSTTPRVIGNDLVFRNSNTDLGVYDDPDDITIDALRIAGAGTGSPNRIELNVGSGRVVDLITADGINLDITSAGALTSGALSATDITINKSGFLVIGDNTSGFTAKEATISATQDIFGHATNGLVAEKATIQANNIGSASNSLKTAVGDLTAKGTQSGGFINVATTDTDLEHLTIESNNSVVTVDTQLVATAANVIAYDDDSQPNSFTFIESGNRSAQISDITASSVDLQFKGNITDGGGVITAGEISLTSEGNIGAAGNAVKVQGASGGATALNVAVKGGNAYLQHTELDSITNDPVATLSYDAGVVNATDGSGKFSSLSLEELQAGKQVTVGTLGTDTHALKEVSITAQGSIVDADSDGDGGAVNIYADKVRLTSIGGSVGTNGNAIETKTNDLLGEGKTGVFLDNDGALDAFNIVTETGDALVSADNGAVRLTSGTLTTDQEVTNAGTASGTVTVNVEKKIGDLTMDGVEIAGSIPGASTLNITATAGNIVSGTGTDITAQNTAINLTAKGNVGGTAAGDKISIALSGSDNTVSVNSGADLDPATEEGTDNTSVGLAITGAPTALSVAHDNGDIAVDVDGTVNAVHRAGNALALKGVDGTGTINYTQRGNVATTLADGSIATNGQSDINITTKGGITGVTTGAAIQAGTKTVSIVTEGNFTASASSTGTGSLSLDGVGGNALVRNNSNLTLKGGAAGDSVAGNLTVHNGTGSSGTDETLQIESLSVGGNATLYNDGTITGSGTAPNLTANSLNVVTTAQNTSLDLDTSVGSISITDTVGASNSNGEFTIDNDKGLGSVTIDSRGTNKIEITTNSDLAEKLSYGDNSSGNSILTASNPDIGNLTITEYQNSIVAGETDLSKTSQTTIKTEAVDASITTSRDGDGKPVGKITTKNLTLETLGGDPDDPANDDAHINVVTEVSQTLDITTAAGSITFEDAGNPTDIKIDTKDGRQVEGKWGPEVDPSNPLGESLWRTLTYDDGTDLFNITNPNSNNTTNVTFETGKGDIVIGVADVGNGGDTGTDPGANLTLIASDDSNNGVTSGRILDNNKDGQTENPDGVIDIIARNAKLVAVGDIGRPDDVLETSVPETLEARSSQGGVYLNSDDQTIDHLIIDVKNNDYEVAFKSKDSTQSDSTVVKYSGASGDLTVTGSTAGTDDGKGTDLTLIEREVGNDVNIASDVSSGRMDFIRIISGGGITNTTDSTLKAGFVDLIANNGDVGSESHAIRTETSELSLDVRGTNKSGYVANVGDLEHLVINVDQNGRAAPGEAVVTVAWTDEEDGHQAVGLTIADTVLTSTSVLNPKNETTPPTIDHVNDAHVYITNGLLDLAGDFGAEPAEATKRDQQFLRTGGYVTGTGGDIRVGVYTAKDNNGNPTPTPGNKPYLELVAKANGTTGSILDATGDGLIDMAGGTVTMYAEGGTIGISGDDGPPSITRDAVRVATGSTVNAYTKKGDINIDGVGTGTIIYNEVYAGANVSYTAPYHNITLPATPDQKNYKFNEGGINAEGIGRSASGKESGNVTLTSGGSMDVVDIVAGTATVGDGNITLEATNNVRIGRLQADQDTVKVTVTGNGNITELPEADGGQEPSDGKVFANTFDAKINGTGDIGSGPSGTGPLDLVVNYVKADVNNGAISLRNIGQVEWTDVRSGTDTADGKDIYLVSEGAAFVKNVVGGGDSDVLIETRSGSDMLVGEVTAEGNTVTLVSTDRIRSDLDGKVTAEKVLLLANSHIGVQAKTTDPTHDVNGKPIMVIAPLQLNADTVAGRSRTGSIYLEEVIAGGSLTVGEVTDAVLGGTTRTAAGLTATGTNQDIHVDVKSGALDVEKSIDAGRNVALRTAGTDNGITIGTGNTDTTVVKAGTTVSLEAAGAVTDDNATGTAAVDAINIVVDAGSLTGAGGTSQFEVNAATMAVRTTGDTFVKDLTDNLTIGQLNTILTPTKQITGSTTTNGDICYEVAEGALTVANVVTAAGIATAPDTARTVGLKAHGNVNVNAAVTATDKISILSTDGALTGSQTLRTTAAGIVGDDNGVVVKTKAAIGEVNGPLSIDTHQFAAWSQEGGVNVKDLAGNLNIAKLSLEVCGAVPEDISGVQGAAGRDIKIDADGGNLILTEVVKAHTGDARTIALRAHNNIDLNNDGRGVVASDKISIEAVNGGLLQTDPNATDPALRTADSGEIVIRANDSIAASGGGSLKIATGKLAAESKTGSVSIIDVDGNLTVGTGILETGSGTVTERTVTGVKAATDVCLEVADTTSGSGNLIINSQVKGTTEKVAVAAQGDITVNTTGSIEAAKKISISSVGGKLSGQGVLSTDHPTLGAGEIVIRTHGDIGDSADPSDVVIIQTDKFAAESKTGSVFVEARGGNLLITEIDPEHCNTALNDKVIGVTSAEDKDIAINVTGGKLSLDKRVGSLTDKSATVALRAQSDIEINSSNLGIIVAKDTVSIESTGGSLTQLPGSGPAIQTDAGGKAVIRTQGEIDLEIDADFLAAESGGDITITNTSGDLTVTTLALLTGPVTNRQVVGVDAAGDVRLTVDETLHVGANIRSQPADGDVIVTAGNQILDTTTGSGTIIGTNVVLEAENGIGESGKRVEVNATNFAAKTTNGDIRVEDIAGGMTVAENVAGTSTSGVTAPGLIDLSVTGGSNSHLTLAALVESTSGNIVLHSDGNTVDGNGAAVNLIANGGNGDVLLTAGGNVGTATDAIEIQAGKLAATATSGSVNVTDTTGDLEVTGVTAGTDVRISVTDTGGDLDITGQIRSTGTGLVHLVAVGDIKDSLVSGTAAVATGGNLVLESNTLNGGTGAFEIATAGLAGNITTGNVTIKDLTGDLTIVNTAGVDGLTAGDGDVCLEVVQQDLIINEEITSTNKDVAIKAGRHIAVNADVTAEDKISAHAVAGNITGPTGRLVTEVTGNDGEVVLRAGGDIGTSPTAGALRVSTDTLAARAGGNVYLQAEDKDLTVAELDSFNCGETAQTVTGILSGAGKEISVNVVHGGLTLDERVGGLAVGEQSSKVALRARDSINLNNSARGGVVAQTKISIESETKGLLNTDLTTGPSLRTTQSGGEIVIRTNDDIRGENDVDGNPTSLRISTDKLAAESKTGSVSIIDVDGNLTVGTGILETGSGTVAERTVTGVKAGDDGNPLTSENVCLEVEAGTLTITQAVSAANGRVAVAAHGDITINADGTGTPANVGAIEARDKISISSTDGGLYGAGLLSTAASTPVDDPGTPELETGGIVIKTKDSIGSDVNNAIQIRTDKFAAQSTHGDVFVDVVNSDLLITKIALEHCDTSLNEEVAGVTSVAGGTIAINVADGSLTLDERVGAETNGSATVALRAHDEIDLGEMKVVATDKISIESVSEGLTGLPTTGPALQTTEPGSGIVIKTQSDINLIVDTDKLAAESTHGDVTIKTTGNRNLEVTKLELEIPETAGDPLEEIVGVKAGTEVATSEDVCLEVIDGSLTIRESIAAEHGKVGLNVNGDIIVNNDTDPSNNGSVYGRDKISILSTGKLSGQGVLSTATTTPNSATPADRGGIVIQTASDIGAAGDRLQILTDKFAATSVTGSVYVDGQQSMTITDLVLNVCGLATPIDVQGVTAGTTGKDVDIAVTGNLNVHDGGVTAGNDVKLTASNNVTLGDAAGSSYGVVTAGNDIAVSAGGNIIDGNDDTTPTIRPNLIANGGNGDVLLTAGGNVGTATDAIEIQAGKLAATATSGSVNVTDTTGDLEVTGVTAGTDVRISVTDTNADEGNLTITGAITSNGSGLVSLDAQGNIADAVSTGAAVITQSGDVILNSEKGFISGVNTSGDPQGPFKIEAENLVANAQGNISVKDLDAANNGLTINSASESDDGNICIETAGVLTVSSTVTAAETADDKGKVALHGGTGVVINNTVTADKKISVLSGGGITNSAAGLLATNNATIANGGGVVLVATGNIGAAGADALNVSTDRLAARSTNGSVYIDSAKALTIADLVLEVCDASGVNTQVTGVTANGQVGIKTVGDLTIGEGEPTPGRVVSISSTHPTNNRISLEAGGSVVDRNNGTDDGDPHYAAVITPGDVVIVATNGAINGGTNSPFEIEASGLAAQAQGSISIKDLDANGDGLTVKSVTPLLGTAPIAAVNGVTSTTGDVCLEVAAPGTTDPVNPNAGKLIVNQAITASHAVNDGKVALNAYSDIIVGAAINADKKLSIHSHTGGLTGASTLSTADAAGEIVIRTDKSIGTSETAPLNVRTTRLAAQSKSESVFIQSDQDLIIAELVLDVCGLGGDVASRTVNGLQSGDSKKVMVNVTGASHDLTFENGAGINDGTNKADLVALKATGDVTLNNNAVKAQEKISIESGGTLTSSVTGGPALETTDTDTSTADGGIVIKTVGDIGSDIVPLVVSTDRLAAQSAGDVYIQETNPGSLTITEIALEYSGGNVGGLIGDEVVALQTAGDLKVATVIETTAATNGIVSLDVDGDLTDENATSTAAVITDTLVVNADSVTGAGGTGAFETAIATLAAQATNNITIKDVDNRALTIGEADLILTDPTNPDKTVTGVTSTDGNICIDEVVSTLTVNEVVTADKGNVGLSALGDITVTANVTAKDKISVYSHTGSLTGAATLGVTNTTSGETVIKTYGTIGSTTDPLTVTTPFLAAESTHGNVYLETTGSVTVADLDLAICDLPSGVDVNVSGVKAGGTNSQVGMAVSGDLTIGRTGDTVAPTISANSLVSLEVGGNVTDNNGTGAAIVTPGDVVITSTNGAISGSGTNTPFEIAAGGLAASAKNDISIKDLAGGLEVKSVRPLLTNTTADVVGVTSEDGNICLEADGGTLTVTSAVTANETAANKGKVALHGGTGIVINNTVTADKKISVLSGGDITGSGTLRTNSATAAERGVVLSAEGDIHGSSATDRLRINTDRLAAESTNGHVLLQTTGADRDLTVTDLVLEVCGVTPRPIEGVTAKEDVEIDVLDGNLRVHSDIESKDSTVALRVQGEQSSVNNSIIIGDGTDGQVKANSIVSLEATGSIVDDNGNNKAAVEAGTLIVKGDSLVGPTSGSPAVTGPFEVKIDTLVAETTNDMKVKDLEGNLTLGQTGPTTTLIGNQTIANSGVTSTDGNICIEAADGVLTVAQAVTANDVGPKTAGVGKVALNGKDGIVLNAAVSADEKISLHSANGGLGGSNRTLTTLAATDGDASTVGEVVIKTANSIGSAATPIIVTTDLLATETTRANQDIFIRSTQNVTIADLVLEVCDPLVAGIPVTGVKADGQVGLDVNGNLTIGQGDPVDGRVVSVTSTHATNNTVSLEATGNIVDENGDDRTAVVTDGTLVVQSDNGSIHLEVEAKTLAAEADNGSISVKDLDTKNDGLTIGTGTTLLGSDAITGVTAEGEICVQTTNGVLQVSESVISTSGHVALHATKGNVVIGDGSGDVKVVQTSGLDKNISIAAGGEIIANNGVDVTGDPNISIIGPNVALRSGTGIGNSSVIGVDAVTLAADGGTGQVHLFDPNGVTIGYVALTGCGLTGDVAGISAAGPITVDVATGDLNIHENIEGGNTIGLRSRDGDLLIGTGDAQVVRTTGTGANGTVSLEASGAIEDNNGEGNAAVITSGTLVIIANTLTGDGDMESGVPTPPSQPNDAFEVEVGGLAIDIADGDVAVVNLGVNRDLTITEGTTILGGVDVVGVTTPADFYLDVRGGGLNVNEDITVGTGDIALAAQGTIILGTADDEDGNGKRGVLKVETPDTTPGLESTVSVESRTGAVLDGHRDKDAPNALVNIDNKGGNVVIFSATGIGGTEPDTADGLEGEIEVDTKYFAGDGGTGDIKLRDLDTGSTPDGLDLSKNLITLIDEKSLTSIRADYDIYLTVDHSDIDVNADIVAGGDVALRTQTGDINIGAQIVAGDKSTTTGKVGTVNLTTNGGSITNTITDGTTAIVAKGNGTTSGGDIVLIAEGSIGAGNAITTDTGRIAAVSENGSISIVEHDNITQDGLTVDKIPTLQDVGREIDGIQAELDVCVDVLPVAGGDLVISRDITSNTKNVGLQSQGGDIRIQSGAVVSTTAAANQVSMVANGQITSANDPATTSSIVSENVVMVAGSGIGNTSAIGIEAVNFAASGGTGDVNIVDRDGNGLTIAELDVDVCHPIVPVTTVTGITTGGSVKVDVTGGDLNVNEDITATNGGVALRTQDGDIVIGDDDTATGSNADVIKAGGKVSLEAFDKDGDGNGGNVVDNNGAGNAAVVTPGNVVIVAEKASGTDNKPFEIEAGGIAAKTTETLKVKDLTGNLKTVNDTTTFGNTPVDGVTSTEGDVCLEVVQGDLDIAEQITSLTGDVRVRANGNVTLSGTDSVSAKNTLVVSSATGEIRDTNTGDFVGDTVVLVAAKGIGNTGEVSLRANKLAANGGTGDVNVIDMTGDLEVGKYVGALICDGPVANVTGLSGGGRIIVDVPNGSLTFTEGINTNPGDPTAKSVTLKTKDEIDLKGHTITAQDKISIESKDGGLIGTTKDGTPDLRTTNTGGNGQVVIKTKDDINVEVATDKLAAQSTGGSVTIKDLTGNLIVTELELEKGGGKVDGVRAEDGVCLEVVEGALEIAEGISSSNGNVKIRANGDVNVTASDDISAKDQLVISSAKGQLVNNGSGDLVGDTVVLVAATGIGNTRDFTLRANTLAANGGTGSVNVIDRDGGLVIGSFTGALICDGPTETITGVTGGGNIGIEVPDGPLVIDAPVTGGGTVAIKTGGDIESNAPVKGGDKISVETSGSIKDGSGNKDPNFEAPEIVIKAGGDIGTKDDNIEINSDKVAATSTGGGVYLEETDGDLNVGTIELEKGGGTVSGVTGKTKVELDVPKGTVTYDNDNPIKAGDAIYIRTRDTLILDGILEAGNRICIDVTNGDILDNNEGTDIRTKDVVMRASGSIGTPENHIDLDVDRVAAEAIRGSVNITEKNGLTITSMEMCNGGGTIPGIKAGTDVNVKVIEGDLTVGYVEAGGNVKLEVDNGDIYDGNGSDLNIKAGGDVELLAPKGYVAPDGDELEIISGTGRIVILEITGYRMPPVSIALAPHLFPPGLFAQDNVAMGLNSFYLDVLYGYLTPEEIALIIEELDRYNYLEDEDFLLEKHPHHKGRKRDEDKDKEQQQ